MNRQEAEKLVLETFNGPKNGRRMAAFNALKKNGYKSTHTGKPLSLSGVYQMYLSARKKAKTKAVPSYGYIAQAKSVTTRNSILREVLKSPDFDSEEKLEIAEIILGV